MKNQTTKPTEPKDNTNPNRNKGNKNRRFGAQRPPRIFWKSLLTNKAFDLFIVIVGILIALGINNLIVSSKDRKLEKVYVENLTSDLTRDIEELDKIAKEIQADYNTVVSYVQEYGKDAVVGDSLASVVVAILSLDTFAGNDNTYQSIVASNAINALASTTRRSQVLEYYNQYKKVKNFEDVYTKAIAEINRYFSPSMNYTLRKISDRNVLSSNQTKNSLLLVAAQLESGIETYEEGLNKAKTLKKSLQGQE